MPGTKTEELLAQIHLCSRRLIFTNPLEALAITAAMLKHCTGIAYIEALINHADLHECFTEYEDATLLYREAIQQCRDTAYQPGLARALIGAANVALDQDCYDDAHRQLNEAQAITEALGDNWLLAQIERIRCYVLADTGQYIEAISAGNNALALYAQERDEFGKVATLVKIGDIRSEQRNPYEARSIFKEVLSLAKAIGYKKVQDMALTLLANIHIANAEYSEAEQLLQDGIRLRERSGIARSYNALAFVRTVQERNDDATRLYTHAYNISRRSKDRYKQTVSLIGLAGISLQVRDYDAAAGYALEAHGIATSAGSKLNVIRASRMLYRIEKSRDNYSGALAYLEECVKLEGELLELEKSFELNAVQKSDELDKKGKETEVERLKNAALKQAFEELDAAKRSVELEKERSEQLLLNILPADVAEELKAKGSSAARQYNDVSVLFTDFVNFTTAAEHLSPQQLVQELNEFFTAFDAIIERNGLEKIKTIGDAYMAVCGLPVHHADHAKKAVQAALEIRDFIELRLASTQPGISVPANASFQIRIGIHSGPVVAGIIGVKKFAYDIWGNTVNTAARMEQHGEAGKINISQATYELVRDYYRCYNRGKLPAKNKGEVAMYFVEGPV